MSATIYRTKNYLCLPDTNSFKDTKRRSTHADFQEDSEKSA